MAVSLIRGNGRGLSTDLWSDDYSGMGDYTEDILVARNENVGYGIHPNLASVDFAVDAAAPTVFYGSEGARGYADGTSASISQLSGMGAGIRLSSGTTQNEEASVQWCGGAGAPFVISDTTAQNRAMVMEWAIRATAGSFANMAGFFGLAEAGQAGADFLVDTTGAIKSNISHIGWHWGADANVDWIYGANGAASQVHAATWKTLTTATWYHFGLIWDVVTDSVTPWFGTGDRLTTAMAADKTSLINSTTVATATFPDGEYMAPIFAVKGLGTADVTLDCRLMAIAQLAPAAD